MITEDTKDSSTKKIKKRTYEELISECTNDDGAIDALKMELLEGSCGTNGGRGCDVTSGPCSCGAWH